jgi:hypothetical protein
VSFLLDNSPSMAGAKFDAATTTMKTQVEDYERLPEGTEFRLQTFNAATAEPTTILTGEFFSSTIHPQIDALTTGGTDAGCTVEALSAMAAALEDETRIDLWLTTDGDSVATTQVNALSQQLTDKQSQASVILLGGCTTTTASLPDLQATSVWDPATATTEVTAAEMEQMTAASATASAANAADALLGTTAVEEPSSGIVPYLLTTARSGGQFLYVDESQLDSAADVLRAQLTHSAGAGRWSDYVSDEATYRWNELASWEFDWVDAGLSEIDPPFGGTYGAFTGVSVPAGLPFYDYSVEFSQVRVYLDGYLTMPSEDYHEENNTAIPTTAEPNAAVYGLWTELSYDYCCDAGGSRSGKILAGTQGDWTIVEYLDMVVGTDNSFAPDDDLTFQIQLNEATGEIRFLYDEVPAGAGETATIGLENSDGTAAVQASYNTAVAAGDGFKFERVPPQPAKSYTVAVDATMESVGFLLTGYSGSFEPLAVRDPDGNPVDCTDTADVLCLRDIDPTNRRVQYVQVDVNGRTGEWTATVDAGPTGSGTFAFTGMGASEIDPESLGDRTRSTGESSDLLLHLGQRADGDTLTGSFRTPQGAAFGGTFTFYDDGAHGDGQAGDGLFGATGFTPPGPGTAYLAVAGAVDGAGFERVDPVPYEFQPIGLTSLGDGVNLGGTTQLEFQLTNHDDVNHCYRFELTMPGGWEHGTWDLFPGCLDPGASTTRTLNITLTGDATNDLPSGTSGVVSLAAIEWEEGVIRDSDSATITRRRPPVVIDIFNPTQTMRPDGDTAPIRFYVLDAEGQPVADGTELTLSAILGTIPATVTTQNGVAEAIFTSGSTEGTATITAETDNGVSATTEILIQPPAPDAIALDAPSSLAPTETTAPLTATVVDRWGNPVEGATVRIGVEGDGTVGAIAGGEVLTGTTNTAGQVSGTFTRIAVSGEAGVRAELLSSEGGDDRVALSDRQVIDLEARQIFLPLALR